MSNQIYSSASEKYFEHPGLNNYIMSAVNPTVASGGLLKIPFDSVSLAQGVSIATPDAAGNIFFDRDGVYSVRAVVSYQMLTGADIPNYSLAMMLSSPLGANGFNLDQHRIIAQNVIANPILLDSVGYTGYFRAGESISVTYENLAPTTVTIQKATSHLSVCRVY